MYLLRIFVCFLVTLQSCQAVIYHFYRDSLLGNLDVYYDVGYMMAPASNARIASYKNTLLDVAPGFTIEIRLHNEYIVADTFDVYINGLLRYVCYYDSDDHQIGNLFDVFVAAQIYQIRDGLHGTCMRV